MNSDASPMNQVRIRFLFNAYYFLKNYFIWLVRTLFFHGLSKHTNNLKLKFY